jgi:TonB-linked SusC/RagA family outer membrane protein
MCGSTLAENIRERCLMLLLLLLSAGSLQASVEYQSEMYAAQSTESLTSYLKKLEEKFHVTFVYDANDVDRGLRIDVTKQLVNLEAALKALSPLGISYKIIGDKVVLQRTQSAGKAVTELFVSGIVSEELGGKMQPMVGVTVLEKGTANGTVTDLNGFYKIQVKENATLVFSMIGYSKQEILVGTRTVINVTMAEESSVLQEVVITGYQNVDKKLFTGSTVNLKGEDIKQNGIVDVSRMLEGRAAGVSVQNVSGTFGAAPKIRIRGATSISGDNKPLWVVDGVVLEDVVNVSNEQLSTGDAKTLIGSSVAGLNSDDIESFQILKDASATAQYGARAMNGVIVITTKKGRVGKPMVSFTSNYSTYLKPSYNRYNIMNSADQMAMYLELEQKGWLNYGSSKRYADGGVFIKMYDLIDQYDETSGEFGLENTDQAKAGFLRRYAGVNTNWFDVLFKNSLLQEHSLSISSGTEKSQLYFSSSFLNDNGWTIADNVRRYTGNARANFNLSDKLTIGIITQGSIREQTAPGTVSRRSNPVEGKFDRDFDINPFSYALNTSRTLTPYDGAGNLEFFKRNYAPFNIIHELSNNRLVLNVLDLKLQGEVSYKFNNNLKYSFLGALRYAKTAREHKVYEHSNMAEAYRADDDPIVRQNNRFLYRNPDDPEAEPVVVLPYGGFYNTNDDYLVSYNIRNTIDWNKTFNNTHIVHLIGLQELRYADRQNKFNYGFGYQFDKGGVPYVDPNIVKMYVEGNFDFYGMSYGYDRFLAWMGSGTYSYKGKYNVSGTMRYDGSNLLGKARSARWLPTWNISGSWNVDTEAFMEQQQIIDRLTLRVTYGLTASMGRAANSSLVLTTDKTPRPYLSEIESVININDLENRDLTWEKQYETNIGFDAGLLNERVTLTLDLYNRNGFDLISPMRTSGIGGQFIKLANYADMQSRGVELTLGGTPYLYKHGEWRTQITLAHNKNKVTNLKSNPTIWELVSADGGAKQGYPYRGLYSVKFHGLDPENGSPLFIDEEGAVSNTVYLQSDETAYLKYEGPVDPTVTGGFFNAFRYKNTTLSVLITFSAGNKIRLNPAFSNSYTDLDATPLEFKDRWLTSGDENHTNIPSIIDIRELGNLEGFNPYAIYNYSSVRVADGGFIRLKQVSLSHTLPASWINRIGASNLTVSLIANNPLLLYADRKLNGQDPEFFSSGGVALPVPQQYTLSLKAGF